MVLASNPAHTRLSFALTGTRANTRAPHNGVARALRRVDPLLRNRRRRHNKREIEAGLGFIFGNRIGHIPYAIDESRTHNPGSDIPDGLTLTPPWPPCPNSTRRDQAIHQYTADCARREGSDVLHGEYGGSVLRQRPEDMSFIAGVGDVVTGA